MELIELANLGTDRNLALSNYWIQSTKYFLTRYLLRKSYLEARADPYEQRLLFRIEDAVGRAIYKNGIYEPAVTGFLVDQLRTEPGDVIIDVGANLGWYSVLLSAHLKDDVSIFAFEPHPQNLELLNHNLSINDCQNVVVVNKGLSDQETELNLYVYPNKNCGRHSFLPVVQNVGSIKVPVTRLDDFWDAQGLGDRVPRFIKIDTEGWEYAVLAGATRVLERCPLVLIEYSPEMLRQAGVEPSMLLQLLEKAGFYASRLDEHGLNPVNDDALLSMDGQCDLLWRKSEPGSCGSGTC